MPALDIFPPRALAALVLTACLCAAPSVLAAPDPVRGKQLLFERACASCHSLDGTPAKAPNLMGLLGRRRRVVSNEVPREIVADEAYIKRSILNPGADVVEGYLPGAMPWLPVKEAEADDLVAAIAALGAPAAPARQGSLGMLLAAAGAFVGLHLGMSSGPVRGRLVARLGAKGFQGVYSLIILAAFAWMLFAWKATPFVELWRPAPWTRWIPTLVMPVAFISMVAGFSTKNPTSAGQEAAASAEPKGIVRVTRHPALWGFALWGLAHLSANGDARSVVLFGSIAFLALAGMWHIDRRRAAMGQGWEAFAVKTSIVPFAAIAAGRNKFVFGEIGVARVFVGLFLYAAMLHGHRLVIGVSALP